MHEVNPYHVEGLLTNMEDGWTIIKYLNRILK